MSPRPWGGDGASTAELGGRHAELALHALDHAAVPLSLRTLVAAVATKTSVDVSLVEELVARLLQGGLLQRCVSARTRLTFAGDERLAEVLAAHAAQTLWPAEARRITVCSLGELGTPPWHARCRAARRLEGPVMTWTTEDGCAWLGPELEGPGPCPLCLLARRVAARPPEADELLVDGLSPLGAVCTQVLRRAELVAAGVWPAGRVLRVSDRGTTEHELLPQPRCPACSARPAHADLARARADAEARFRRDWEEGDRSEPSMPTRAVWLDEHLGPLQIMEYAADGLLRDLPLMLGSIRLAEPRGEVLERLELFSVTFGSGMTEARRRLVAFAEGVERYGLSVDSPDVKARSFRQLAGVAIDPAETVRHLSSQYTGDAGAPVPYRDEPIDWSWVYDWTKDEARLVAHDVVGSPRDLPEGGVRVVDDPFSSGATAHRSLPLALRRACLEVIERDAFLLTWYLRLPLRELDAARAGGPETQELRRYLDERGIELRMFDMRVDFPFPSVLVVARARRDCGQWRAGGYIVSPSCSTTWEGAATHALGEILGHYSAFALVAPEGDASVDPSSGCTRAWWPGFAAYFEPPKSDPFAFLGSSAGAPPPSEPEPLPTEQSLTRLRAELRERDLPVLVRHMAPEAVGASGLVAIRVCIPGLLRMTATREAVNLGEPRLEAVRARWAAPPGLNPLRHPIA